VSEDARELDGPSPPDVLPNPAGHPDPDRLYAYQANELTPEEDLEIQEHLAVCGHCTELLLDIQRFTAPPAEEEADLSEFEQAAGWRQLRARLDQDGFFNRSRRPRSQVAAMAAIFALAILGLTIYSLTRRPETRLTYSLDPFGNTRGEASQKIDEIKLPATLLLRWQSSTRYEEYRAEIQNRDGGNVRRFPGLRQDPTFHVELKLDRSDLSPGEYQLDLVGLRDGRSEEVEEYRFRIPQQE